MFIKVEFLSFSVSTFAVDGSTYILPIFRRPGPLWV